MPDLSNVLAFGLISLGGVALADGHGACRIGCTHVDGKPALK